MLADEDLKRRYFCDKENQNDSPLLFKPEVKVAENTVEAQAVAFPSSRFVDMTRCDAVGSGSCSITRSRAHTND